MRKAFTLMEMMVALGILAVILSFAGVIFRVSIDSHRLALANAEIMQKLRAITEQLDVDFRGLRKEGEIFVVWRAARKPGFTGANPNDPNAFERFDRIMFFAAGDFQTYPLSRPLARSNPDRSNLARICYALANGPSANPDDPNRPQMQKPQRRVLARTQHLLDAPYSTTVNRDDPLGMSAYTDAQWRQWNSESQEEGITLRGWQLIPMAIKAHMLSVIGDVPIEGANPSTKNETAGGITVDPAQPNTLHSLLCEGVGQLKIQGWSDAEARWIPEVDPNGNGDLTDDSDFFLNGTDLDTGEVPGVWYPNGAAIFRDYRVDDLWGMDLRDVPGLGRALRFTFTLYDSRGLIRNGRTFTHIVYLDN